MNLDSFLAPPKWDLLAIIAHKPSSPIELAEQTKTTVSYVSQQLKLLEAVGLIVKHKTGAFEKGKPRNLYSLAESFAYVSLLTKGFATKNRFLLTPHMLVLFRIWSLENSVFHLHLEKFFLLIDGYLPNVMAIYVDTHNPSLNLSLVLKDASFKPKIIAASKQLDTKLFLSFVTEKDFETIDPGLIHVLFDSTNILNREPTVLKGGDTS